MSKEFIDLKVSQRICSHMNKDHKESLMGYASFYANIKNPVDVKMIEISSKAIKLEVDGAFVEIPFDHELIDSEDAHQTLVSMSRKLKKD